ncbi:MAG TPA: sigma-70 family RNA polymerase sigma factor [Acidimicrobiia bacterium]|nr:sigma-70 family RNA polymerase sigma factor [Acidimicrobiia bacterium]
MPGDRRFDDFYAFDHPKLVAALRLTTGDDDTAREAVDEACARAWERLQRGDEIEVLAAWIRVVAINGARGGFRRRAVERRAQSRLAIRAIADVPESTASLAEALDVRAALSQLAGRQREIVVSFYFLDLSVETIARDLRIPEGTVKATLHRARRVLADALAERTNEPHEVQP